MTSEAIHVPESGGFSADDLAKHVKLCGGKGLQREFMSIEEEPINATYIEAEKEENLYYRNRYYNVLAMDHSRVRLGKSKKYMNANFADGYKQKNAYITTQGPIDETFEDFWEMVWEQHVLTIAMATRITDGGRYQLCGEYWPTTKGRSTVFGDYEVTNDGVERTQDYAVTSLVLRNVQTEDTRRLTHVHFLSWPDYGVPNCPTAFLDFLFRVRQSQREAVERLGDDWTGDPMGPPVVVHCSAGIGRTGTFCVVDISLRRLDDIGTVDVPGTLRGLRSQRSLSIQTTEQYIFTYLAILEDAQRQGRVRDSDLNDFVKRFSHDWKTQRV